ncbi:MAG: hypothetical protein A2992_01240 [Elusimicrobia bacterium RIFCSPLOWO2_01_FULL_59_12]|nr:MAG: hypothetical protein A2992_01240 [Elusimicrobia bacterium RIFCSPLOWO2_01_FULL_59_12]
MKSLMNRRGLTLVEMLLTAAIVAVVAAAFALMLPSNITFLQRTRVRQQVLVQSRQCMEAIQQAMRNGMARTLVISTPNATPIVPNSRVDFAFKSPLASGATSYAIYVAEKTVYAQEFAPGVTRAPKALASNVTGLMFTGDYRDPSNVSVTLRIDAPWDSTNMPGRVSSLIIPNQLVRMAEAP